MNSQSPDARPIASDSARRIVVLLVDDQAFVGAAVRLLLASEPDIELHCCTKARQAITMANQIAPTVVLQDLVMPEIDGLTLVRSFHDNPITAGTPVVILSGSDDAETRQRALAAGAQGYLVKLPPKAELIACLREHGSRQRNGEKTLDRAVIEGFMDAGVPDFTHRLINQFLDEAAACVQTLREARDRGDAPLLKATAHRLRGSAMIMGATRLAGLCAQVEAQPVCVSTVTAALLADIVDELPRLQHALAVERDGIVR